MVEASARHRFIHMDSALDYTNDESKQRWYGALDEDGRDFYRRIAECHLSGAYDLFVKYVKENLEGEGHVSH